jgi:uncharacterized membrane protein YdbT with pleckstrin-like domain
MSYIEHSLGSNETLHYRARFPAIYHVAAWGILALGFLATFTLAMYQLGWIGLAASVIGAISFLAIMLPMLTTEIGVTTQRLIYKRGWVWRTTKELQLRAIEQVTLDQSFLGRLFNYGRISVHGTGVDDITLPALGEPIVLQRAIQDALSPAATSTVAVAEPRIRAS